MGHEANIVGFIDGATWRTGSEYRRLQLANAGVIAALPATDEWPFLTRGMFALPDTEPYGIYRSQIIHFGLSIKAEPGDRAWWDTWLAKFEDVLRRMYWVSAEVDMRTELESDYAYRWTPTDHAIDLMNSDPPHPIAEWTRTSQGRGGETP
jgi:hypothetical protein